MNFVKTYSPENLLLAAIFGAHALSQSIANIEPQRLNRPIARMRGIRDVLSMLKQSDFDTAITYGIIRKLIDQKEIKSVKAGKKILVNLDEVLVYFNVGGTKYGDNP
jgi:hypothetical protein